MEVRRAFLLAAGLGTRLKPLTNDIPKCLLPLGGQPLLHWWLKTLERLGVREALVNVHHLPEQVAGFLCSRDYRVRIRFSYEPELLGSAGTIAANRSFVAGEKSFWIFYADTVIAADLKKLIPLHRRTRSCLTLGLFRPANPKSCGVVELGPDNRVSSFQEKPKQPRSDLAAAGAYLAGPGFLRAFPRGRMRHPLDLGKDLFPKLARRAAGMVLNGPVIDIGTRAGYSKAQRAWKGLKKRFGGDS